MAKPHPAHRTIRRLCLVLLFSTCALTVQPCLTAHSSRVSRRWGCSVSRKRCNIGPLTGWRSVLFLFLILVFLANVEPMKSQTEWVERPICLIAFDLCCFCHVQLMFRASNSQDNALLKRHKTNRDKESARLRRKSASLAYRECNRRASRGSVP